MENKIKVVELFAGVGGLGVPLSGRAFRFNLFARPSQKGFPLQSLTQRAA
jgi:hypothetical protein